MITMKFGGTSLGDTRRLADVVTIVKTHISTKPAIVASAMSGITDTLLETARLSVQRETEKVKNNFEAMKEKHFNVADTLIKDSARREELIDRQSAIFDELASLLRGVSLLKELSPRSLDAIASFGEILSCLQIAAILNDSGIPAEFIDTRKVIRTDARFGEAVVDFSVTDTRIREILLPLIDRSIVPVITGFIGSTETGLTTTLGRSGSDYTGSIVGAATGSAEIWIWTDVDGVMTADPRYVKGARVLSAISYREAAEMSYFGAKVIHPKTMLPAIEHDIPIRIKNTFNPTHPGTLISSSAPETKQIVKNVTSIDHLSLVAIEGNGMLGVPGVSARIFTTLARIKVNVMMISQASSEHNVCIVIPQKDSENAVDALQSEFKTDISAKNIDAVKLQTEVSIIAIVGERMKGTRGIAGKTFSALAQAGVNVVAIAQGSSELNISLVVEQEDAPKAVQAIHDAFQEL
ncbi:MAG: aspartate kinase [Acidobacteria bacterium]|nr:aspartate kinase [Acidobacteriota bacterium]